MIIPREEKRFAFNSSDASITLVSPSVKNTDGGIKSVVLTSLMMSVSGAGELIFFSDNHELFRITFSAATVEPWVLNRQQEGWMKTIKGETLKISNVNELTLQGSGNYYEM